MGLFKSLDSIHDIESNPIGVTFKTIEYTYDSFFSKIKDNTLSDEDIQLNIKRCYEEYLNYDNFKDVNTRKIFQSIWTNTRFLRNFIKVLETDKSLNISTLSITTICKIAYDYFSIADDDPSQIKDNEVLELLFKMAEIVNFNIIIQLSTIMGMEAAKFICLSRYSSFKQEECISRLNECIINFGVEYQFSIKNIVYIYSRFFAFDFSSLFIHSMVLYKDTLTMSSAQEFVYNNISYALLLILNSLTSQDIYKTLKRYGCYLTLMNNPIIRFSMKSLSNDFNRVSNVIQQLSDEGIVIP